MESKWIARSRQVWAAIASFLPVVLTLLCSTGIWCAQAGFGEALTGLGESLIGIAVGVAVLVGRFSAGNLSWVAVGIASLAAIAQAAQQLTGAQADPQITEGIAGFASSIVAAISAVLVAWSKLRPDNPTTGAPAKLTAAPVVATASAP